MYSHKINYFINRSKLEYTGALLFSCYGYTKIRRNQGLKWATTSLGGLKYCDSD